MSPPAEDPPTENPPSEYEDAGEPEPAAAALAPSFPTGRVRRIMRMDPEIKKVNSDAIFLITLSVERFVESLAEKAAVAVANKRRKTIKLEHLRTAVCNHPPTADFLLDCLSGPPDPPSPVAKKKSGMEKPLPAGARRIDQFFSKSSGAVRDA